MEREIKFRGQTLSGDWVTGNLSVLKEKLTGFNFVEKGTYISNKSGSPFAYQVRPETLGQYTGFKDAGGSELYPDDIIENDGVFYKIEWDSHNGCWDAIDVVSFENISLSELASSRETWLQGNIYENIELLNKKGESL